ncbi:MAG: phage integrase N-terminal SAM-like domain-containing protein [Syntrophales bacterium]|nr:phage integrase N-terminal SAM-like domain-containing protein [Syntrophales bacterium]
MGITREYFIYRQKYTNVRRWKRSPTAARERQRIVVDFLCHIKGHVFAIKDIKREDYDQYMNFLRSRRGLAVGTQDRYRYALKEFFKEAKLNIPVKTGPKKRHSERMNKLARALSKSGIPPEYHNEMFEIAERIFYANPKK